MKITRFSFLSALALLTITTLPQAAQAQVTFPNWASATSGTLGGVNFTITGLISPSVTFFDLSGSNFSAAPGSNAQESIAYAGDSSWTITFASPVNNLNLYPIAWRSNSYDIDKAFTIISGMPNTTTAGNTVITNNGFTSGIIRIPGSISSLNVSVASGFGFQVLNFSVPAAAAPEPGTLAFLALGGTLVIVKRRR